MTFLFNTCKKSSIATSLFILSGFFISKITFAGAVSIDLNFKKKPAKFGIAYIYDESTTPLQGLVDQKDKQFVNSIIPVSTGSTLTFKNSDTVDHNIFANELSDTLNLQFDVGLMPVGSEQNINVDWSNGTLVRLGCKIHPKMKAYVANIKAQEYHIFEFKKKKSNYSITLQPASDDATVKILLDRYDPISTTVQLGESQTVDLIKKGKVRGTVTLSHQ